jgi:DNA uptake protein ComE-like DNA-binding protein
MYRRFVAAVLAVALAVLVVPALAVAGSASKAAPTSKVNLNTANAEQLATLPGVGPALAAGSWSTARSPVPSARPRT